MADDDLDPRGRCIRCRRLLALPEPGAPSPFYLLPGRLPRSRLCTDCVALGSDELNVDPRKRLLLDLVDACERVISSAEGHADPNYRRLGEAIARATATWRREQRMPAASEVFRVLSVIAADVAGVADVVEVDKAGNVPEPPLPFPPRADDDDDGGA